MATSPRVALIFGVGSNIGSALVKGFLGAGYRVATVSRSERAVDDDDDGVHSIRADLSDPGSVPDVFSRLSAAGLAFPSVVIWNAAALSPPSDPSNPLEVGLDALGRDLDLMITSPYVAAREAVRVWQKQQGEEEEEEGRRGTFIMTGNMLPRKALTVPTLTTLGVGKSGANSWIGLADSTFKGKGMRFFFADQRSAEGGPAGNKPDGDGHAEMYLRLTSDEELPSYVTFGPGGKYQDFFP